MNSWDLILNRANNKNFKPFIQFNKSNEEWEKLLPKEVFEVTRLGLTEDSFSSQMCNLFTPGYYICSNCESILFTSEKKFKSNTGWPSFSTPFKEESLNFFNDNSLGLERIEVRCASCDAHLGHVFNDGPAPSNLRFCINAMALKKIEEIYETVLGGGCFWCTEAIFRNVKGVLDVESGYSGGLSEHPDYESVSLEQTNHAEVIKIAFNPQIISFREIIDLHLATHDPTTLNSQGNDTGTRYRSIIFYKTLAEKIVIEEEIIKKEKELGKEIVTEVVELKKFYKAEDYHQDYYYKNSSLPYCRVVIAPKLKKLQKWYKKFTK